MDNNGVAYSHGMGKEAPEPIYQNFDLEDVPRSTHPSKQKYESAFPLYVNALSFTFQQQPACNCISSSGLQMILGIAIPTTLGLCLVLYLVIIKGSKIHIRTQTKLQQGSLLV
ncbi:unnamed protein product [Caretta caretta]